MITLIEKTIEKVHFKLEVDETQPDRSIAGSPILYIDGEAHIIYAVDTLKVIKAISNSQNLIYVKKGIRGSWAEETVCETIAKLEKEHGYV